MTYEENLFKAYAFLWEKCIKGMQNKIASRKDFESRIYNHPINILKSKKEHLLIKKRGMRCPSSRTPYTLSYMQNKKNLNPYMIIQDISKHAEI